MVRQVFQHSVQRQGPPAFEFTIAYIPRVPAEQRFDRLLQDEHVFKKSIGDSVKRRYIFTGLGNPQEQFGDKKKREEGNVTLLLLCPCVSTHPHPIHPPPPLLPYPDFPLTCPPTLPTLAQSGCKICVYMSLHGLQLGQNILHASSACGLPPPPPLSLSLCREGVDDHEQQVTRL